MKKILLLGITLIMLMSGCSANINDAYKMVEDINNIANTEAFTDYYIKGTNKTSNTTLNYELKKDNANYYLKLDNNHYYLIENNNSYHIYESLNGVKSHYKKEESIGNLLEEYASRMSINTNMNNMHYNIAKHIENLLGYCSENNAICNVSKDLFNKKSIEVVQETNISKRVSCYTTSKGKITSISSEYKEETMYFNTIIEIDYSSQNLNNFNKNEYKIVNKNS